MKIKKKKKKKGEHESHGEHKVNCAAWGCKCQLKAEKKEKKEKKREAAAEVKQSVKLASHKDYGNKKVTIMHRTRIPS